MVKAKMMNENSFAKLIKELSSLGELVRTRQEEKQAVIDEFDKERGRYMAGKISEEALKSSCRKTNQEFSRIDKNIRDIIVKSNKLEMRIKEFIGRQYPKVFVAKVVGIGSKQTKAKSKKSTKKTRSKKSKTAVKAWIKEELKAEKKLIR